VIPFVPLQFQFLAKFVLILAIAGIGGFAGWRLTSDYYQSEIFRLRAENDAAVMAELQRQQKLTQDRAELTRLAEEQHAKDQLAINHLGAQLAGVRVQLPTGCGTMPGTAAAGANPDGTGGLATARADEYLAAAQRAIQDIGQRCAQLNIDAIAANNKQLNNTVKP